MNGQHDSSPRTVWGKAKIDTFLAQHADSSLFLRSFLARGGLVDEGKPLKGTYTVAVTDEQLVGVAMHS